MRLRIILLVLATLALTSTATGLVISFHSFRESALAEARQLGQVRAERLADQVTHLLNDQTQAAQAMAGARDFALALLTPDPPELDQAGRILERFRSAFGASRCYLLDRNGIVLADAHQNTPTSVIGQNFAFRPYFLEAMQGRPGMYLALGTATRERGVYGSAPIYGAGRNQVIGVVVVKALVQEIEDAFRRVPRGTVLLADPNGMVFASSRAEWLFSTLWSLPPQITEQLMSTEQFGRGPWPSLGLRINANNQAVDDLGGNYLHYSQQVERIPGWKIHYFTPLLEITSGLFGPFIQGAGALALILFILVGVAVAILYARASKDILTRQKTKEALELSESRYRQILGNIVEGFFEMDLNGGITFFNEAGRLMLGFSPEEMPGLSYKAFARPENVDLVYQQFNEIYRTGRPIPRADYQIRTKSGEIRTLEVSIAGIAGAGGRITGFRVVARDITEQRKTEIALRESEERSRAVLEASPDSIAIYDMEGRLIYFNPAFTRVFGYQLDECQGRTMDHYVPPEAAVETRKMIAKVMAGESVSDIDTIRLTKSGFLIPVTITGATYRDDQGRPLGTVSIIRDVRARRNLEAQVRQFQKIEAAGTMAGGMAHDFNNLLQTISGYLQILQGRCDESSENAKYLHGMDAAIARAIDLARRLLAFSQRTHPAQRPLNLNAEVQQALALLRLNADHTVFIESFLTEDLYPVSGDPTQIGQVLMALGSNALEAMPDGGRMTWSTRNVTMDEAQARSFVDLLPGDYVLLRVADTGFGMDEDILGRIFEPFFSTKPLGQGRGLNLAGTQAIIKAHGGHILAHARLGLGTAIEVYLPAMRPGPSAVLAHALEPIPPETRAGREIILVVDDEKSIREVAREFLEASGFPVLEAETGEQALTIFKERGQDLALIILDLGMPGMGGLSCLQEIMRLDPTAQVIIASGYATDGPIEASLAAGAKGFLAKPYRLTELKRLILDTLGRTA